MRNNSAWDVIFTASSNHIILGVDFPAAGRGEADFGDLAEKMGALWDGYTFLQTTPPTVRLAERPSGDFYTEHWFEGQDWSQHEVVAVFGYCAGSIYAAELAQRLAKGQEREPQIVLFDPQLIDHQLLAREINKMVAKAGPVFTADEGRQVQQKAAEIIERNAGNITDAAIDIIGLYYEMTTLAFGRLGLADARRDEVVRLVESYMTWLASAAQIDPSEVWGRSTAITSADWAAMESSGEPTVVNASKALGTKFPLPVKHADLLRSDGAAALLSKEVDIRSV